MHQVILKQFDYPDEVRTFEKGKFELVLLARFPGEPLVVTPYSLLFTAFQTDTQTRT